MALEFLQFCTTSLTTGVWRQLCLIVNGMKTKLLLADGTVAFVATATLSVYPLTTNYRYMFNENMKSGSMIGQSWSDYEK